MLLQLFTQTGITIISVNGLANLFTDVNVTDPEQIQVSVHLLNNTSSVSYGSFHCLVAVARQTFGWWL